MAKVVNDHITTLTVKFLWPVWCWGSLSFSRYLLESLGYSTEILDASKQLFQRMVHPCGIGAWGRRRDQKLAPNFACN